MKVGWQRKRISDVATVIAGQSPEGKFYNEVGNGLPFYQGKKEFGPKFIGPATTWTSQVTKEAAADDILMSVRAPVGPINFATERICIGRGLAAIRVKEGTDKNFLFYFLLSKQDEISGKEGAVFASINKAEIESIEIAVPALNEQQRIVAILDEAFDGIATAKANAEKNLQNARDVFTSSLSSWASDAKLGWLDTTVGNQMLLQRGFDITKEQQQPGQIPVVSSGGIKSFHNQSMVQGPGVVIGRKGTLGKVFYLEGEFWPHDTTLWVKDFKGNHPRFVYHFLRTLDVVSLNSGAANPALNRNQVHPIQTSWPPIEQQGPLVEQLDALEIESERLAEVYEKKFAMLDELKQSLLHRAFNGDL